MTACLCRHKGQYRDIHDQPMTCRSWMRTLLLAPASLLFVLFFVAPFFSLTADGFPDDWRMAGIVAVLALLVGYPVALCLQAASAWAKSLMIALLLLPLLISVIARIFGWAVILGVLENAFAAIGIAGLALPNTGAAAMVGLVLALMPFVVFAVLISLQAMNPALPLAAASLGAGPLRVLWKIILPFSLPGIAAGLLSVFALAAAGLATPVLRDGADCTALPNAICQQALALRNWPFAAAVVVTWLVITLLTRDARSGRHARRQHDR